MSATDVLLDACTLIPKRKAGECSWCHGPLQGKQRQWCSKACSAEFVRNHSWSSARNWALKLSNNACIACGEKGGYRYDTKWGRSTLEVNHIVPVVGDRSSYSCNHHQANLEVLCFECHRRVTREQHKSGTFKRPLTT